MFRTMKPNVSATGTTNRRRVGTLATSATAALALTAGLALPACAADEDTTAATVTEQVTEEVTEPAGSPGTAAEPAADETSAATTEQVNEGGEADGRLQEAIELAKAEGHISDDEWVADPSFEIARGEAGDVSAQVITITGGTSTSPQAVLLYGPGHGKYVATAQVPEDVAGDIRWGDRVGNVRMMGLTQDKDIGVVWMHPDGNSANVIYRYANGYFELLPGQ